MIAWQLVSLGLPELHRQGGRRKDVRPVTKIRVLYVHSGVCSAHARNVGEDNLINLGVASGL